MSNIEKLVDFINEYGADEGSFDRFIAFLNICANGKEVKA